MTDLDIYKISVDEEVPNEDSGISQIAFVKNPAIKVKGLAFNSQQEKSLIFSDSLKLRIAAPAMIPMNIYRNDSGEEYFIQFTQEEIEKIFVKFMKNLNNKEKFNLEHNPEKEVPAFILEAWLVGKDPKKDRSYSEFNIEVPTGTLFLVAQLTDRNYFEKLIENEQIGFSIEGLFGLRFSDHTNKKVNMKKNKMTSAKRLKAYRLEDAEIVESEMTLVVESLDPLAEALVIDENLEIIEDFTGVLSVEDQTVTLEDGVITEVTSEEEEEVIEEELAEEVEEEIKEEVKEEVTLQITEEERTAIVSEVMQILEPKFMEIYDMIAELKSYHEDTEITEDQEPAQFSIHQKYQEVFKFLNK